MLISFAFVIAAAAETHTPLRAVTVQPSSRIAYTLTHRVHEVVGTASEEIQVQIGFGGPVAHVHIAVPIVRFESGNKRRDENMAIELDSATYPLVEIVGELADALPARFPGTVKRVLTGELIFHGVHRSVSIPLELRWNDRTTVHVSGQFATSLEAHKIERPSLMFVKVEDRLPITVNLDLVL